jgi:hypothetical protein
MLTNVAITTLILVMSLTVGFQDYLPMQFPTILLVGSVGTWLFYIQHQYEDAYLVTQRRLGSDPLRFGMQFLLLSCQRFYNGCR